jgi:alpha-L-fucosidase
MSRGATGGDLGWFLEARFGMFIHLGLYSSLARHEWVMSREETAPADYERYVRYFDPDLYDPGEWARAAADAGMRYVVLTTKHHEGFCLWDSALSDYTVMATPYGKDLIGPFVEAVRAAGLKVGFYHSLLDWHHPDFAVDDFHPLRSRGDVAALNQGRDADRYREYLHGQVRELLTRYGTIDYLFMDFSYKDGTIPESSVLPGKGPDFWGSAELLAMIRQLQPGIVVNDRLGIPGDFVTPEQYQPAGPMTADGEPIRWEACQTLNGSWGYDRDNLDYKPVDLLVRMLVDGVSKDGNMLLNVGPTARGNFDPRAIASLHGLGDWMRLHGRSIHGAGPAAFTAPPDARYTQRGDQLYLHLFAWPFQHVHLPGMAGLVEYAQLLNDASEIGLVSLPPGAQAGLIHPGGQPEGTLTLKLPVQRPDVALPVIELFLKPGS